MSLMRCRIVNAPSSFQLPTTEDTLRRAHTAVGRCCMKQKVTHHRNCVLRTYLQQSAAVALIGVCAPNLLTAERRSSAYRRSFDAAGVREILNITNAAGFSMLYYMRRN